MKFKKFRLNNGTNIRPIKTTVNPGHYYDTDYVTEFPIGHYYVENIKSLPCLFLSKQKYNLNVGSYFVKEEFDLIWEFRMMTANGKEEVTKQVFRKEEVVVLVNYKSDSGSRYRPMDIGDLSDNNTHIQADYATVSLYYTQLEEAHKIHKGLKKYVNKLKTKSRISLLTSSHGHLDTLEQDIKSVDIDVETNYGAEFVPVHLKIVEKLSEDRGKGLVLLHGVPGTGKTNYIRYLCGILKKEIIFLPPFLAENLASPDFITFLLEHTNSILIIEDAEKVVLDREGEHSNRQSVANLLNVTDGLLSDCLSIQILATFNTSRDRIDKALLRKGRLIAEWKFDALSVEASNNILKSIGREPIATKPMTLTEIYNMDEEEFVIQQERPKIGFGR